MGKYLLGIVTALIFVAAAVVWFSRPENMPTAGGDGLPAGASTTSSDN